MTITEFLTARYDELEAVARGVHYRGVALVDDEYAWVPDDVDAVAVNADHVLADIAAKRAIVARLVSTKHVVLEEDCWYTCAAATVERDGGETCDENRNGGPCDCGRDARVEGCLALLAQPYAEHPDFDPAWRVS